MTPISISDPSHRQRARRRPCEAPRFAFPQVGLPAGPFLRAVLLPGLFLLGLALFPPAAAVAQNQLRPAAVVNDEAISALDLAMRVRITMVSAKLEDTAEVRNRVAAEAIRNLVDELLRAQEAERLGYSVGEDEVTRAIDQIAARNNLSKEAFWSVLTENGILPQAFRDQVAGELLWQKLVQFHLKPQVQVAEDEVDRVAERIVASSGNLQWQLAEILLAVDTVLDKDRVLQNARRVREALQRGASFQALARQVSDSASSANGGDLGWIQQGQLDPNLERALIQAGPGMVVGPLESLNGFHFFLVRDVKRIADAGTEVELKQLLYPLDPDAGEDDQKDAEARLLELRGELESCDDLKEQADELGTGSSTDLGQLKLGDMPPELRAVVASLEVNEASAPVDLGVGLSLLMVCERSSAEVDRAAIRNRLENERLDVAARRYMRDLRRDANIDIRM